jgi:hypothetical protein
MCAEEFPTNEPLEFKLAWLQEQRQDHLTLLGHCLAQSGRDDEIGSCMDRLEQIERQEILIENSTTRSVPGKASR